MQNVNFSTVDPNGQEYMPALLKKICMPSDTSEQILRLEGYLPNELKERAWDKIVACQDYDRELNESAQTLDTYKEMGAMVLFASLSRKTLSLYRSRKLDTEIFLNSMTELTVWERACREQFGRTGLERWGWLAGTLRLSLFRIGRFQFEPSSYHSRSYAIGGVSIAPGDPVLNIHIPEDGPMPADVRRESYRKAYDFFRDQPRKTDGSIVFTCDSWLLYPAHRTMLPETSNIRDFLSDFVIMDSNEARGAYGDLWRIFGHRYTPGDWNTLTEDTGLKRAYKQHLLETDCTGGGYGVFLYNGAEFKK